MNIFDEWNQQKQKIHNKDLPEFYVNPREIWYTKMGKNVGFEQSGKKDFKRPVLVLKKIGSLFFVVSMTTKGKDNPYYQRLETADFVPQHQLHAESSYIVVSQVKVMDKRRFIEKMGYISADEFKTIKEKLKDVLL